MAAVALNDESELSSVLILSLRDFFAEVLDDKQKEYIF